jgi:hypothetical protein
MAIQSSAISNPVISRGANEAARDMALFYERDTLYCFYSSVTKDQQRYQWCLEVTETTDGVNWSPSRRLTTSKLNFSSPGNIIRHQDEYVMCVQSYPSEDGDGCGTEESRLWLMRSKDLVLWDDPTPMNPEGSQATWTETRRQIDPYIVEFHGKFWCFCKTSGQTSLLVSDDLLEWTEASPDRPVLSKDQTSNVGHENPCVVQNENEFVMFFSKCGPGRGHGIACSDDLLNWRDVHYLDFPELPWANNGPSAAMVIDLRQEIGVWLMAFHGEEIGTEPLGRWGASIGLAWGETLEDWTVP